MTHDTRRYVKDWMTRYSVKPPKMCRCCEGHWKDGPTMVTDAWHRCSDCGETCRCLGCNIDSNRERAAV